MESNLREPVFLIRQIIMITQSAKRCNEGCELMPTAEGPNPLTKATTLQPSTQKRRR